MKREEIEIEIKDSGETVVHIKGVKGKKCLSYAKLLEEALGSMKEIRHTAEFYEPDIEVEITDRLHGRKDE